MSCKPSKRLFLAGLLIAIAVSAIMFSRWQDKQHEHYMQSLYALGYEP